MLNQFENMLLAPLIEKLNSHGIKVDEDMIKKAVSNSPQIVEQIEQILLASSPQEKLQKIQQIIMQASQGGSTTSSTTTTNGTPTGSTKK